MTQVEDNSPPPVQESLGKKSARGAAWASISRGVQQGTQMVSISVLAKLLDSTDYGLMAMGTVFINFLQLLGDMGTGSAIVQKEHVTPRLASSLFWANALLGLAGGIVLFFAAPGVAAFYHQPKVTLLLSVLAVSFPLAGIGMVPQSLLIREMEYRKLCIVEAGSAMLAATVAIVAAWNGFGVWSLVAGSLTSSVATAALSWSLSGWHPQWVLDWGEIRGVLGFSMNLTGFVFVNYLSRNTGHLVVGRFLGAEALGYYQMAYSLLLYPLQAVSSVLGRVMFVTLSRIQSDQERFRGAMLRYLTLLGTVNFPVFLGLMVVAAPVITLFLAPKWAPVIPLFMIVAPVGALHSVTSPTGQIYLSTGRTDVMLKLGVVGMIVQICGYFAGIPWGLPGILLGWGLSSIPVGLAGLIISHRLVGASVKKLLWNLWPAAAAAVVMAAVTWGWRMLLVYMGVAWPVLDLASSVLVGSAVYVAALWALDPAILEEVDQILAYSNKPLAIALRTRVARMQAEKMRVGQA